MSTFTFDLERLKQKR